MFGLHNTANIQILPINMHANKSGRMTIKINVKCSTHSLLVIINLYLHSRHIYVHTTDYAI